uniref:RNA-directed DNA polymerase, eukaryota n=1 Tax=Tanacetum cinerariifolium TaxID=118510 RepID=A0A6L2KER2_TANCI|nr:RNA-directed DNA polymerase, eukaryota [Tanacetum cinerariifolium]
MVINLKVTYLYSKLYLCKFFHGKNAIVSIQDPLYKSRDIEAFVFLCNMVRQTTRMITRWWDVSYEDVVDYDDWRTWIINLRLPSKNKMMLKGNMYYLSDFEELNGGYVAFGGNPKGGRIYRKAHEACFTALETHVDRLLDQLNKDEIYEPHGITMLDFDDEDKDESEEQNEEFTLHSKNTMEWSAFGSCKDKVDAYDHNNSFEDIISSIKEHDKESVPFKVGEGVMEGNTTPYLPTLEELILQLIDDIRSKEDEEFLALLLYEDEVAINQAGEDDSLFKNKKEREKVSLVKDEHHVDEWCHENSLSKLTHIIVKQVHRKAWVGVRKQILYLCHGKREFQEVLNSRKLINFASKKLRKNMFALLQTEEKER